MELCGDDNDLTLYWQHLLAVGPQFARLDWKDAEKMRFVLDNLIEGLSPTNSPVLSPLGWKAMIDTGERTAWPKVEMVRTQTAISRALEGILARIDRAGDDGPGHRSTAALKKAVR